MVSLLSKVLLRVFSNTTVREHRFFAFFMFHFSHPYMTPGKAIALAIWILILNSNNNNFCFIDYAKAFDCVDHNKLWKILQEMGIPEHLTSLLINLYAGQEATVRTGHGMADWKRGTRLHIVTLLI